MKNTDLTIGGTPMPEPDKQDAPSTPDASPPEDSDAQETPTYNDTSRPLEERIVEVIKEIYDPEIPVNIYELGLIYEILPDTSTGDVKVIMTLTSPACPAAQSLPLEVRTGIARIVDVNEVDVEITFDPQWTPDNMSDAAKLKMGLF